MIALIGINTGEIYANGKCKAECFRELGKVFPSLQKNERGTDTILDIYPEPLKIVKMGGEIYDC